MHDRRYTLPRELSEFKVLCPAARKPALLAALLAEVAPQGPTIVFTASVAMAHRCNGVVSVRSAQLLIMRKRTVPPHTHGRRSGSHHCFAVART